MRVIVNAAIILLVAFGFGLIYLMQQNMGEIEQIYIAEAGVSGIPFNMHFRMISILGMLAVILFQISLFVMVNCKREWRTLTWSTGFLFYHIAGFHSFIAESSRIFLQCTLRDYGYDFGYEFVRVWTYLDYVIYIMLILVGILYVARWLFFDETDLCDYARIQKRNTFFVIVNAIVGISLLILKSFTNIWYLVLCLVSAITSWFLLKKAENLWNKYKMDDEEDER